jgi:hypothetical protein
VEGSQVLHGSATTTEVVGRAIQHSKESLRALPKRHTLLSLDDCLDGPAGDDPASDALLIAPLPATLRHQRAARGRWRQARPKEVQGVSIRYFRVDLAEMRIEQGKLYLLAAIDRLQVRFVELHEKATRRAAADFLRHLAAVLPCRIHTVLTDNGTHFSDPTADGWTPEDVKEMRLRSCLSLPRLRCCLRRARHRAAPDQAASPGDEQPGRTDEPDDQEATATGVFWACGPGHRLAEQFILHRPSCPAAVATRVVVPSVIYLTLI